MVPNFKLLLVNLPLWF